MTTTEAWVALKCDHCGVETMAKTHDGKLVIKKGEHFLVLEVNTLLTLLADCVTSNTNPTK